MNTPPAAVAVLHYSYIVKAKISKYHFLSLELCVLVADSWSWSYVYNQNSEQLELTAKPFI